jgi:peptidoglycan/xylan/chitin deacetylase (PgdA/CDA1 family)
LAGLKKTIIRGGLATLYFSGAHHFLRPLLGGVGAILMLHHVRPSRLDQFAPNRHLEVTPAFLEKLVCWLKQAGVDIISLGEMHQRLIAGDVGRRFVCITFDDGYRDNREWAYPILKKHQVPFAIYVATSFPEHLGELWWLALEAVIAKSPRVGLVIDGVERTFECADPSAKRRAYSDLYNWLRSRETEEEIRVAVRDLAARYQVDTVAFCRELCMGWDELAALAADPLVTIGAHTVNHVMLAKVGEQAMRSELDMSRAAIEAWLGRRPEHLAYPVGDPVAAGPREFAAAAELGFKTAVTTRPGVLFADHREHLTALPRISVNGDFQQLRHIRVLLSGAATAMWNGFKRVDAA